MTACIFLGPSLAADEALALCPAARILPPVQQGDIYAAVQHFKPSAIGVIDGYFQHSPSVWHKEILWALNEGIHVLGAASMGALRAAELEAFGMTGVGAVFEAYRSGTMPPFDGLTDDDEVAVTHGPAETGYVNISDAMVNIRHTLMAATRHNIIDDQLEQALIREAKQLHFPERKYAFILDQARKNGACTKSLDRLQAWLPSGKIDQKRIDAEQLFRQMQTLLSSDVPAHAPCFRFETTEIWHNALPSIALQLNEVSSDAHHQRVLDELRLDAYAYAAVKQEAYLRLLSTAQSGAQSASMGGSTKPITTRHMRRLADEFRRTHQLSDRTRVDDWLTNNDLTTADFDELIRCEARLEMFITIPDTADIVKTAIDCLRIQGNYAQLSTRARCKTGLLGAMPTPTLPAPQLLLWYFESHCNQPVPADIDAHARRLGLDDENGFLTLIAREYRYLNESRVDKDAHSGDC